MFRKALQVLEPLGRGVKFGMSEARYALKREGESKLALKIKQALSPTYIRVDDISIGSSSCGQMFNITVESEKFRGISLVQQHQLVTRSITEELKQIHGYNLKTKVPETEKEL